MSLAGTFFNSLHSSQSNSKCRMLEVGIFSFGLGKNKFAKLVRLGSCPISITDSISVVVSDNSLKIEFLLHSYSVSFTRILLIQKVLKYDIIKWDKEVTIDGNRYRKVLLAHTDVRKGAFSELFCKPKLN